MDILLIGCLEKPEEVDQEIQRGPMDIYIYIYMCVMCAYVFLIKYFLKARRGLMSIFHYEYLSKA